MLIEHFLDKKAGYLLLSYPMSVAQFSFNTEDILGAQEKVMLYDIPTTVRSQKMLGDTMAQSLVIVGVRNNTQSCASLFKSRSTRYATDLELAVKGDWVHVNPVATLMGFTAQFIRVFEKEDTECYAQLVIAPAIRGRSYKHIAPAFRYYIDHKYASLPCRNMFTADNEPETV